MQVASVASQLQQQLITNTKPQSTSKPTTSSPTPVPTDNDGDHDNGAPDKGQAVDTKA